MNFLMKNNLFYLFLLSCTLPSVAMQLQRSDANFVHLTELHEENPNQKLDNALYSFEPSSVVREKVKKAIRQGADVKAIYRDGKTSLHKAFEFPDITIAELLVENSPSLVNFRDKEGNTLLNDAIAKKDVVTVKFLLKKGVSLKKGRISPLKMIIDNARDNRPHARGGLSYWPTTEELVRMVGKASSLTAIKEAQKYLKTQPYNDHYNIYIRKPLSEIAAGKEEKERKNAFSPCRERKSPSSDNDSASAKKEKNKGESLSSSQKEIIRSEGKRLIQIPNRFNSSLTKEEIKHMRKKRWDLQQSNDKKRIKK